MATTDTRPIRKLTGKEDFDGLSHATPSLPASWYYDADWHQRELDNIFYDNWLYLCHSSTLSSPRAFRSFTIGTQGVFLVRDDVGTVRGFHNTCRHRGSVLCLESDGRFPNKLIRCPYHQWAYSLDGRLVATSSHAEAVDFDKADYPLFPIAVREWKGGIFVSLSDNPPDLEHGFGRGSDRIENWPMEKLVVGHTWQKTIDCNWKIFWENFNECLHCPNIHPELVDLVPIYGRRISYYRDEPNWPQHHGNPEPQFAGGLREGATSWSTDGKSQGARFDGLTDEEIARGQSYFVSTPSVFIAAHVDYMRTVRILPLGPEQTDITVEWLFLPETLEDPDFDLENVTDFAKLVMLQDSDASEINQRGIRSRRFEQGVLMPEEHYVKGFHDWVREQMEPGDT